MPMPQEFGPIPRGVDGEENGGVERALRTVRRLLGMDAAYLSEFVDGRSVFRAVDAPGYEAIAYVGGSLALQDVYCQHILDGRLPELIPDTRAEPVAMAMPITSALPIGAHVSIPIRRPDGRIYGMFCCLGREPNPSLNERDLGITRVFAELAATEIHGWLERRRDLEEKQARIDAALAGAFTMVYQPIFDLSAREPVGLEALCRFTGPPQRTPDIWFKEAAAIGRQVDLEIAVIRRALAALADLPASLYVSVNASPETIVQGGLCEVLAPHGFERVVLEVTEHAAVADYAALERALAPLRLRGVRLAVDDTGAGYSGLQHILRLRPDLLKLDMALTRSIDTDHARRALASALVHFASETRAAIVAEGIETQGELAALRNIGIGLGQGYLLGRPMALGAALGLVGAGARRRPA